MFSTLKLQRYALYLYFFSLNFEMFNLFGLGSTSRLTGVAYLLTISLNYKPFLRTSLIKPFLWPWVVFWFYLSVISFFHVNEVSYQVFDVTLLLNIVYFWFLLNHERRDPGVLLKGFLAFALSGVLLTVFYKLGIGIEYAGARVSIFGDNENAIAVRLVMAVIILLYLFATQTLPLGKWRWLLVLPLPSMLFFMLDTGSRKAVVALVLAFLLGVVFIKMRKWWHKIFIFIASGGLAVYFLALFLQNETLVKRLNQVVEEKGIANRDDVWDNALMIISDNFVFGAGMTGYAKQTVNNLGVYMSPHNVLLEVFAYTGLIGFLVYFYFLMRVGLGAAYSYQRKKFLLPLLLLIPIASLILAGQALTVKIVWCSFALAAVSVFYKKGAFLK